MSTFGDLSHSFGDMGIPGPGLNFFFYSAQIADGHHFYFLLHHRPASLHTGGCLYDAGLPLCRRPTSVSSSLSSYIVSIFWVFRLDGEVLEEKVSVAVLLSINGMLRPVWASSCLKSKERISLT